ncbi:hypothetical protein [Alteromonas sp. C1M14]|uniref:hypothetical protein n=1 Tax=Alteromonas sp. C1M14 TaxID=2841567 RepID=UPI001C09AF06|nr:hypothetical protein [Alteromonas sp. C1M14]MBU2978598.1 hypothetical protein [Alteromonas sp. C1M14]
MSRYFLSIIPFFFVASCSVSSVPSPQVTVTQVHTLNPDLGETSGLFCRDGSAFSINDSGNAPELFVIDKQGEITGRVTLDAKNKDWETITGDDEFLYIGDIGNNAGKRKDLKIYQVSASTGDVSSTIRVAYEGNKTDENIPYSHDYDGEAMTMRDGKILIFSKSWGTETSHIYQVDVDKSEQLLTPIANVEGLPGVVTGVDWSDKLQQFVLVGYRSNALGMFKPFVAVVSANYDVESVFPLAEFTQVEGVCHGPDNEVWISQESTPYSSAKLAVLSL